MPFEQKTLTSFFAPVGAKPTVPPQKRTTSSQRASQVQGDTSSSGDGKTTSRQDSASAARQRPQAPSLLRQSSQNRSTLSLRTGTSPDKQSGLRSSSLSNLSNLRAPPPDRQPATRASPRRPTTPSSKTTPSGRTTPTRVLFDKASIETSTGKRNAELAQLSPKKERRKAARTTSSSPNPSPPAALARPSSVPDLPSSPLSPFSPPQPENVKPRFDPSMEIKGSDDEDDDDSDSSGSSFPELEILMKPRAQVPQTGTSTTKCATPKSRGKLGRVHQSPLTVHPKPLFNMKTLLEHQRKENAIQASLDRLVEHDNAAKEEAAQAGSDLPLAKPSPNTARRTFIHVAGVKDDETAGKALRAMERTEAASSVKNRWYFFDPNDSGRNKTPEAYPRKAAKGPWAILAKDGTRAVHLRSSLFKDIAYRFGLPDAIFTWALRSIGSEPSLQVCQEYCDLVSHAPPNQIHRLVTPEFLQETLLQFGAAPHFNDKKFQPVMQVESAYQDRDWAGLHLFFDWLHNIAPHLQPEARFYAVSTLCRMAADEALLLGADLRIAYQYALLGLAEAVDWPLWNEFCEQVAESLYISFDQSPFRIAPLMRMCGSTPRLRQLRRRLAIAFFLDDPAFARVHPHDVGIMQEAINRLEENDFRINRHMDYDELRAKIQLLDIALGDGAFVPDESNAEHEKVFNADADHLAQQLKTIWANIKDSGAVYLSRTEAKSSIDSAQKRLTYQVRTRPPPKESIFDMPGERKEEVTQKQKDFMNDFLSTLKKTRAAKIKEDVRQEGAAAAHTDDEATDCDETFMTAHGE